VGLRIWVTNSALRMCLTGNQEMAIEKENIMDCKFGTSCLNPAIKWKYKMGLQANSALIPGEELNHMINAVRRSKISLISASTIPYFFPKL
jgi:hypothetical protein